MTTHHYKLVLALMSKNIKQTSINSKAKQTNHSFDSDSFEIVIDCAATMSITNNKKDFMGSTKKSDITIRCITGTSKVTE